MFGNPLEVTDKHITKIINNRRNIKQGEFMEKEFEKGMNKIKGLDEIPLEVWKTIKFDVYFFD